MKVREYIEELKKLDQEKGIWVAYDCVCRIFDPIPDDTADKDFADYFNGRGHTDVKEGDYIINAM